MTNLKINVAVCSGGLLLFFILICGGIAVAQEDINIHAFAAQGFLKTDKNNNLADTSKGSFEFREMGINFSKSATPALWIGAQLFARDLGDLGNNDVSIDWIYGDFLYREWLGLRIGTLKTTHGLYNESRDSDMMRTAIFLPQSVYNEAWRDSLLSIHGGGIYGNLFGHLSYQFQMGILDADMEGSMVKLFDGSGYGTINAVKQTDKPVMTGQLQVYDLLVNGLKLNASFMNNRFTLDIVNNGLNLQVDGNLEMYAAGLEYTREAFTFSSEYVRMNWSFPMKMKATGTPVVKAAPFMMGWYVNTAYRFTSWFEVGAYYSEFFWDKDDKYGKTYALGDPFERYSLDACLSLRFDLNSNWVLKIEGHTVEGVGTMFVKDNLASSGKKDFEKYWNLFAAKVIFAF